MGRSVPSGRRRASFRDVKIPRQQTHAGREAALTFVLLWACIVIAVAVDVLLAVEFAGDVASRRWVPALGAAVFGVTITALNYGSVVYLMSRWGLYRRHDAVAVCERVTAGQASVFAPDADPGALTVLIPSYREDLAVVRQTVLSAALQDYPDRRVVILVDDPPAPSAPDDARALEAVRALPDDVGRMLRRPAARMAAARDGFDRRRSVDTSHRAPTFLREEAARVCDLYDAAADWCEASAAQETAADHTDRHFIDLTFVRRAEACREHARRVRQASVDGGLTERHLAAEYRRLVAMFTVTVTTFERKRFVNLSHEPNKAMNLNAYIGLLGRRWRAVDGDDGTRLVADAAGAGVAGGAARGAVIDVPGSRWLLTVDADSILTHDYAARLVGEMSTAEHRRTAVMQTPYLAVPGARGRLERTAGATTDIMHRVHQGGTHFSATFWVGANALLRVAALGDIAVHDTERGHAVTRYIQDRTVIEDTESTIDLVDSGWRLHNYPAQLAFSATPPDYGALLIQRRRWANGGLIILPKLLRSFARPGRRRRFAEALIRVHYLTSPTLATVALLVLMSVPFTTAVPLWLLAAMCVPYFAAYARDLRLSGRRRRDLFDVYALNLLLVPVQLGGVLKSIQQGITRRRIPFGRTPKVTGRTAAPALYVAVTLALLVQWTIVTVLDVAAGNPVHAIVVGGHAVILMVAIGRFAGWRNTMADLRAPLRRRAVTRSLSPTADVASSGVGLATGAVVTVGEA